MPEAKTFERAKLIILINWILIAIGAAGYVIYMAALILFADEVVAEVGKEGIDEKTATSAIWLVGIILLVGIVLEAGLNFMLSKGVHGNDRNKIKIWLIISAVFLVINLLSLIFQVRLTAIPLIIYRGGAMYFIRNFKKELDAESDGGRHGGGAVYSKPDMGGV